MKKTAIVILNWNGADMLAQYLPSVINYSREEADIYVADNGSTDNSLELLTDRFPQCRTIMLDKNYGFAEGYNRALAQIDSEYYVLLNSDVEVTHHWLTPLLEFMDTYADVAACQPKLLSALDHDKFEYAGASGGFIDCYGYPFCRGRVFGNVEIDDGQYDNITDIHWGTGACLLIRAADYHTVGGFDPRFFAHSEEIDLCWRLRLRGRRICCLPESCVYHLGGGTLPKGNPMKTYLNFRNNLAMLYKCLPDADLRHVMRIRRLTDALAALVMLIKDCSLGDFRAVRRARRDFHSWKRELDVSRREIQATSLQVQASGAGRTPFSILYQYYIKGIHTFSKMPC
ncbi:MAG: glycosyltransferase family 2 protein [Hoylesella marshii]|uniref:glycosyltransferase family 2 protein n=1 Tax=Hoylesella marshii TaxID=189722 RepID=UPI003FA02ED8